MVLAQGHGGRAATHQPRDRVAGVQRGQLAARHVDDAERERRAVELSALHHFPMRRQKGFCACLLQRRTGWRELEELQHRVEDECLEHLRASLAPVAICNQAKAKSLATHDNVLSPPMRILAFQDQLMNARCHL